MQVTKWLHFAAIWILVSCQDDDGGVNPDTQNYEYRYFVRDPSTGDVKSQEETKQDGVVTGHYSLDEPTGNRRVVTYTADDGGFRADVKYEEGGLEDKAQQTSAKSGVEFHWLPAQPGGIQEGKSGTEQDNDEASGNGTSDKSQSDTESTTASISEAPSESTSEASTETMSSTQPSNDISTSESVTVSTTEGSSETTSKSESEITLTSVETTSESNVVSTESSEESPTPSEGKNTDEPDSDSDQSAEVAESAPVSEEVLPPSPPSQMYLPVISYQNLPFLNLPGQAYSEKPPTIIYASQNFYNPWQWFGSSRRVVRDTHLTNSYKQSLMKHREYHFVPKTK